MADLTLRGVHSADGAQACSSITLKGFGEQANQVISIPLALSSRAAEWNRWLGSKLVSSAEHC